MIARLVGPPFAVGPGVSKVDTDETFAVHKTEGLHAKLLTAQP